MSTCLVLKISRNPKAGRGLRVGKLAFRLGDSPGRQFRKISPTLYPSPPEASGERDGTEVPASPDAV
ncbi:hypothetical protein AWW68_14995 [Roseivirga spongicola]|uniref:Uncharacterized protein n=1 Tax=Roseivirga spongicola TaxID=333140 RepID=A0A150X5H9_9BACT|nr:hypothetical protein AWW68_14995 [Roseivirga spongicola]